MDNVQQYSLWIGFIDYFFRHVEKKCAFAEGKLM